MNVTPPRRGERNHNPCNLRFNTAIRWQGLDEPPADDHGLCRFVDDAHGLRAGAKDILTKYRVDRLRTVRAIIDKYAPPNENNTESYIDYVSKSMGVSADAILGLAHEDTLFEFIKAVIDQEEGRDIYPDALVRQAVVEALM
jgi:hypothetical protein